MGGGVATLGTVAKAAVVGPVRSGVVGPVRSGVVTLGTVANAVVMILANAVEFGVVAIACVAGTVAKAVVTTLANAVEVGIVANAVEGGTVAKAAVNTLANAVVGTLAKAVLSEYDGVISGSLGVGGTGTLAKAVVGTLAKAVLSGVTSLTGFSRFVLVLFGFSALGAGVGATTGSGLAAALAIISSAFVSFSEKELSVTSSKPVIGNSLTA